MLLPIDEVLPELLATLKTHANVVLSAAPGAGKTTRVPLAIWQSKQMSGKILMLEPRRLAAMRAAQYMAKQLGECVGQTVGYRIRGDNKVSAATQIEVVTEGILTRQLQNDPELRGVSCVIFDEFHERSLHADLGLALSFDVQQNCRDDLKLVVMSATLDGVTIAERLGDAPIISSAGRQFPIQTYYVGKPRDRLEHAIVATTQRALREHEGDVLVFLPGQAEIRRCENALRDAAVNAVVHSLFGEAHPAQQHAALQPDPTGARKIILATNIAETSLTIDGVAIVIDSGLARTARFDPRRGMSGLTTVAISQASAEQRKGRAGRQRDGACYRLWHESQHVSLAKFSTPEIMQSDLMPLALELAQWGSDETQLLFLDKPPASLLSQARTVLLELGALDAREKITAHGKKMAAMPVHPRFAHMLIHASENGFAAIACDVAALLEERDLLRGQQNDVDLHSRWQMLRFGGAGDGNARERVKAQAKRLCTLLHVDDSLVDEHKLGLCVALAYPERVAKRRDDKGERWQTASGVGAQLLTPSVLAKQEWIAIADVDGEGQNARIFLAADVAQDDLRQHLPEMIFTGEETLWSPREQAVIARHVSRFGAIVFSESPLPAKGEAVVSAMCQGIAQMGLAVLPWDSVSTQWLQRVRWLQAQQCLDEKIDFSDAALLRSLPQWLAPFLNGITRRSQLNQLDLMTALKSVLDFSTCQQIDQLAPTHLTVPTGSRIALDYSGEQPVLAVRLQEMFGVEQTPRIANGRAPVLIHLLSPAQRPLAVTQDLSNFWRNVYPDVRKDMRGQYPKHHWPENPLDAEPTRRSKAADDRAKKKQAE